MHPDLEIIRKALYSGQISAQKVDAQRALVRVEAHLSHYLRLSDNAGAVTRAPHTAGLVATWDTIKELFHSLWGDAAAVKYRKEIWIELQRHLETLERATESLDPQARENLVTELRRAQTP